jgi:hypothetical protein
MKYPIGFLCLFLVASVMFFSTSRSAASDPGRELITTRVSRADVDWLRSATVDWDDCEAGAPVIEPPGARLFSLRANNRLGALLPIFFLHARFEPGVYDIGAGRPFEVTPDHLKLLKAASWEGVAIDCKRPYGDFTNFPIDMARALSLPITVGEDMIARISPRDDERMQALHLEMQQVVAAYLRHGDLAPGTYRSPRGGLEPEGAARPRLAPPSESDFNKFLEEMPKARKAEDDWSVYAVIAELYSIQ